MNKNDQAVREFILNSTEILTTTLIVSSVLHGFEGAPFKNVQNASKRVAQIIKMMLDEKLIAYWSTPDTDQICRVEDADKHALSCEKFVSLLKREDTTAQTYNSGDISVHGIALGDNQFQIKEQDNGHVILYHTSQYIPIHDLTEKLNLTYSHNLDKYQDTYCIEIGEEELENRGLFLDTDTILYFCKILQRNVGNEYKIVPIFRPDKALPANQHKILDIWDKTVREYETNLVHYSDYDVYRYGDGHWKHPTNVLVWSGKAFSGADAVRRAIRAGTTRSLGQYFQAV